MRVALYGNNLNAGYFITRMLNEAGIETRLFCRTDYSDAQETHQWWTSVDRDQRIVREIPAIRLDRRQSLTSIGAVQQLYDEVAKYDVLLFSEDGPAVFSELRGPKKVLWSWGWDLQNLPFILTQSLSWWSTKEFLKTHLRAALHGDLGSGLVIPYRAVFFPRYVQGLRLVQQRQRLGLHQCDALILHPHTEDLVDLLRLDRNRIHYMAIPMDPTVLAEVDASEVARLQRYFSGVDLIIVHPTRQFYLKLNDDPFLKDNDKLIHAFARFVQQTSKTVKLLLIRKGRAQDIKSTQRLIRRLRLGDKVQWLPEMPNKTLRAYYQLENVVVCDQFCPKIAVMGNTGREATFFGRPLITAFGEDNRLLFDNDMPQHVFPADSINGILAALRGVEKLTAQELTCLSKSAKGWFTRQLARDAVLPKLRTILESTMSQKAIGY